MHSRLKNDRYFHGPAGFLMNDINWFVYHFKKLAFDKCWFVLLGPVQADGLSFSGTNCTQMLLLLALTNF